MKINKMIKITSLLYIVHMCIEKKLTHPDGSVEILKLLLKQQYSQLGF